MKQEEIGGNESSSGEEKEPLDVSNNEGVSTAGDEKKSESSKGVGSVNVEEKNDEAIELEETTQEEKNVEELKIQMDKLIKEAENPVILFPSSDAVPASSIKDQGNLLIIVLDGSWKDAKRMNA